MSLRLLVLFALCAAGVFAQGSGVIFGNATDSSGAAVPNVSITVTNENTQISTTVKSNEQGYYIVSAGENVPWRVRTRPNSYINYQCFPKMIEGHMISDVVAVLGSINIIAAELDR